MKINDLIKGKSNIFALIGNPISHTISPQIHNTLCSALGIDNIYIPFEVDDRGFDNAVKGLKSMGVKGFNVTVPYKNRIIKHLDTISIEGKFLGSINTVKITDGELHGYSTDGLGFLKSYKLETGESFEDRKITLIGAGGTTRAIAGKLIFEKPREINIINRTYRNAEKLVEVLKNYNEETSAVAYPMNENAEYIFAQSDIIINTTSVGMDPDIDKTPLNNTGFINKNQIFYDVIYNPGETKFLKAAKDRGCRVINGFGMLVFQAVASFEIWNDIEVDEKTLKDLFESIKAMYRL